MSTGIVVYEDRNDPQNSVAGRRRSGGFLRALCLLTLAGGCGAAISNAFENRGSFLPQSADRVELANVKVTGLLQDVINGRLINEGGGGEVFFWTEWNGEPACARHTYLRADSEYNFSFVCDRMTWSSGELRTFASQSPPAWVSRAAKSF